LHLQAKLDTPVAKFLFAGVANKYLSVVVHVSRHCENLSTTGVRVQRQVDNLYDETRGLLPQPICKRQSLLAAPASRDDEYFENAHCCFHTLFDALIQL